MDIFRKKKQEPVRLHKQEPKRKTHLNKVALVQFTVTLLIILAVIIMVLICFALIPPTHGFYWW